MEIKESPLKRLLYKTSPVPQDCGVASAGLLNWLRKLVDVGHWASKPYHSGPEVGTRIVHVPIRPSDDFGIGVDLKAP